MIICQMVEGDIDVDMETSHASLWLFLHRLDFDTLQIWIYLLHSLQHAFACFTSIVIQHKTEV